MSVVLFPLAILLALGVCPIELLFILLYGKNSSFLLLVEMPVFLYSSLFIWSIFDTAHAYLVLLL
jgi:hypothetical protein